jgi:MFS family permease
MDAGQLPAAEVHTQQRPQPSSLYRWLVLIFVSLAQFGNYYIYDSINPLESVFRDQLGFSASMFGWLNASYSAAAIVTLLIGGKLIDRFGIRKALMLFSALCLLGAQLTAWQGNYQTMIAGRTLLGLGAESQIVAVTVALARWFKGKELGFAFGINLTIARLASIAADNSRFWAQFAFYPNGINAPQSWRGPLLLAVALGSTTVIGAAVYWMLERYAEGRYALGKSGEPDKLSFAEGLKFNTSYWYVVGLCVTFYSGIYPFRTFAVDLFTSRILHLSGELSSSVTALASAQKQAGFYNSLLPFSAMIATPLFGLLADKFGKRATFMVVGSFLMMPVYLLFAYSTISLVVPVGMLGIAFSLIPAVMWPSVAYLVDEHRLGTAYALMSLLQQVGFLIFNALIGPTKDYGHAGLDNFNGYALGMWCFSVLGFLALFFAILLRQRETGPEAHGLETITTATGAA